jgi:pyruvate dehydrogenase E2 component (dihydrolipoamide acetyltransferase)
MTEALASDVRTFCLPDLGEGLTAAEVVEWKVAVGDSVSVDQSVVEVETAKAVVDVPVPFAGVVHQLHGAPGDSVTVGAPLISVHPGPRAGDGPEERGTEGSGSGSVLVGYGTGHGPRTRSALSPARPGTAPDRQALVISPVVRHLAARHDVDVDALVPSGAGGVVLRRDVEAAIRRAASPQVTRAAAAPQVTRIPLRGIHRSMADAVARSRREIPDVTVWVEADATALFAARDRLRTAAGGVDVSVLALFARICTAGLLRFPALNSRFDAARNEVLRPAHVNLGFAAHTEHGLLVPVVHHADRTPLPQLAATMRRLTDAARTGRLTPADATGGTFTLNNYGVFGVDGATPVINHPEAAMLGIGRCADRPHVVDGQVTVRMTTQLSLTFDHRVCDGGTAAAFLRFVADHTEDPLLLLNCL